ncbi:ABC transporter permease [Bacillus sp. HMF5848]|uniref:ABC transporter permease n=1 Tax=Bacillus sp. HMF5848 TaxID=2495421 RepID=UPI000F78AE99|nr:ABC transporter permease [Bacillus sp. HMF5848]RSK26313.1 ABC transporter permease [Bacillus sp. HMF5848]
MNKFFIILWHTYFTKLKTKSFIITTILTAVFLVGLVNMQSIIGMFTGDDVRRVAVVDESGALFNEMSQNIVSESLQLEKVEGPATSFESQVLDGTYNGILTVSLNDSGLPVASYISMSFTDTETISSLEQAIQQVKVEIATSQLGLTAVEVASLYEPIPFEKVALEENAKSEEELNQARGLVYFLLFIIYFSVIMYASMIAMEVATEKSSRVMEILISSVSPIQQMFAKILGIGLLSLTQFITITVVGYLSVQQNMSNLQGGFFDYFGLSQIPTATIIYAGVFFLLGYFLFATLAAFLGSLVSRIEDVQQMITPMTLLIVAAFMIAMFGLTKPDATFITVTSFIPFFAPMIMFLRVGMLSIPVWEIALCIGLLVGTIILLAVIGARIYRGGVLMYGKSNSFKDLAKAWQLSKE